MYKITSQEDETGLNTSESTSLIDGINQNECAKNEMGSFDLELRAESYSGDLNSYLGKPNIGTHIALLTCGNKVVLTLGPHWYLFATGILFIAVFGWYTASTF